MQLLAQSFPIHLMNCYLLPKGFLHELDILFANFWWGDSSDKRKIH